MKVQKDLLAMIVNIPKKISANFVFLLILTF